MKRPIKLKKVTLNGSMFVESVNISAKPPILRYLTHVLEEGDYAAALTVDVISCCENLNSMKVYFYDPVCSEITGDDVRKWFASLESLVLKVF